MSLCDTKVNSFPPQRFPFHLELQDSSVVGRQRRVQYIVYLVTSQSFTSHDLRTLSHNGDHKASQPSLPRYTSSQKIKDSEGSTLDVTLP